MKTLRKATGFALAQRAKNRTFNIDFDSGTGARELPQLGQSPCAQGVHTEIANSMVSRCRAIACHMLARANQNTKVRSAQESKRLILRHAVGGSLQLDIVLRSVAWKQQSWG